jgi:hypothetical protein
MDSLRIHQLVQYGTKYVGFDCDAKGVFNNPPKRTKVIKTLALVVGRVLA